MSSAHLDNSAAILSLQKLANQRDASLNLTEDGWMKIGGETYSYLKSRLPVETSVPSIPGVSSPPKNRRIWLSAGHGGSDPGVVANGVKEADLAIELRDLVRGRIPSSIEVWTDPNAWATATTAPYVGGKSKAGDIVCDLHFNAYNGTAHGVEVIVPESPTAFEIALGQKIAKGIAQSIGSVLRGNAGVKTESESQHKRLAMMRPAGENILIEVCFLDNPSELARYRANILRVAEVIAIGLAG